MATWNTQSDHRIRSNTPGNQTAHANTRRKQMVLAAGDFTNNHRATSNTQIKLQIDVTCTLTKPNGQRLRCPHNSPCSRWLAHVGELTCAVWTTSQLSEIAQTSISETPFFLKLDLQFRTKFLTALWDRPGISDLFTVRRRNPNMAGYEHIHHIWEKAIEYNWCPISSAAK